MSYFELKNPSLTKAIIVYLSNKPITESDFSLILIYLREYIGNLDVSEEIQKELVKLKRKSLPRFLQLLQTEGIYPF